MFSEAWIFHLTWPPHHWSVFKALIVIYSVSGDQYYIDDKTGNILAIVSQAATAIQDLLIASQV